MKNYHYFLNQFISLRTYVYFILTYILLSYSIYLFYDVNTIMMLGYEDSLFENLSFIFYVVSAIFSLIIFIKNKSIYFFLLFLIFFIGAGEEISWGQRIFNFDTPTSIQEINVQDEFNLHNIEIFNSNNFDRSTKQGLGKLTTFNFLYKLFWLSWCVLLPLLVFNFEFIKKITCWLKLPIPAFTIGIFFIVNWLTFRLIHTYLLPVGEHRQYYDTIGEIRETGSSFIFLVLIFYFYRQLRSQNK